MRYIFIIKPIGLPPDKLDGERNQGRVKELFPPKLLERWNCYELRKKGPGLEQICTGDWEYSSARVKLKVSIGYPSRC